MLTPTHATPTMNARRFNRNLALIGVLWASVLVSGVGVVYSTYLSRQLFNELNSLHHTAGDLHVQWGQYLLEQSTWAAYSRVEQVAKDDLKMTVPPVETIVMVEK